MMGFSFGFLIWVPMAFGRASTPHSMISDNYLTFVSVYALLLLSDALFWNSFGFDRSAAQVYFLVPLKLSTVLVGKNITAAFFVLLEICAVAAVCALLRLPLSVLQVLEAVTITIVVTMFLLSIGNLSSVYSPRAVNPMKYFRTADLQIDRKKDGTPIEVEIVSHPVVFDGHDAQLVLSVDVTERRQLEQQLRQAAGAPARVLRRRDTTAAQFSHDILPESSNGDAVRVSAAISAAVESIAGRVRVRARFPAKRYGLRVHSNRVAPSGHGAKLCFSDVNVCCVTLKCRMKNQSADLHER